MVSDIGLLSRCFRKEHLFFQSAGGFFRRPTLPMNSVKEPRLSTSVVNARGLIGKDRNELFLGGAVLGEAQIGFRRRPLVIAHYFCRLLQRCEKGAVELRSWINPKTVAKWKKRPSAADLPTGPKEPRSTVLSVEEEAVGRYQVIWSVLERSPDILRDHQRLRLACRSEAERRRPDARLA